KRSRIGIDLAYRLGVDARRANRDARIIVRSQLDCLLGILNRFAVLSQLDAGVTAAVVGVAIPWIEFDRGVEIVQGGPPCLPYQVCPAAVGICDRIPAERQGLAVIVDGLLVPPELRAD